MTNELTNQESEIIDFMNEKSIQYEKDNLIAIKKLVVNKFGDEGLKVWNSIYEDIDETEMIEDCPECGKIPEELGRKLDEMNELFGIVMDDQYDDLVEILIGFDGACIEKSEIDEKIKNEITEDPSEILKIRKILMTKILLNGITEGWLYSEIFQ